MTDVLRCSDQGRLQALRAQELINGIDYMVVVDGGEVPDGLQQRILLVRFVLPIPDDTLDSAPGEAHAVRIVGGQRVVDPSVRWVSRLSVLDSATLDSTLDPVDTAYLDALAVAAVEIDHWLVVMVDQYGDHSPYRLLLRSGDGPPAGYDFVLSEIVFSFKVECPSPFDCVRQAACAPAPVDEPELDYLSRDFSSFRRLMFDRLALISPDDPSRDPATLRSALVEVLAYAADRLAYFQDAVATESYLTTARTRPSVRRHSRLLGYPMHEGCNARAFVQLRVQSGVTVGGSPISTGCQLLTRIPLAGPTIAPADYADALAHDPERFEVLLGPDTVTTAHNSIAIHTWGNGDCCLPAGTTEVWLVDDSLALVEGDLLMLHQTADPTTLLAADADPEARHVVRLTAVDPAVVDDLLGVTARRVTWDEQDALPEPLVVSVGDHPVAAAGANLVLVDHGGEVVEALTMTHWGNQGMVRALLQQPGLTWRHLPDGPELDQLTASSLLHQDPRQALPEVDLVGEGEEWHPSRDLLRTPASSREFVVEMESDGRARLRFGDDVMGRRPTDASVAASHTSPEVDPTGSRFSARYRIGNGPSGNVGAGSIAHIVADPTLVDAAVVAGLDTVANPLPAVGGVAPETLHEVRRDAPQAYRVQERAVTLADWIEVAERHPTVQRARARLHWTGSWQTVFLTVDPVAGVEIDEIRDDLVRDLDRYRLAGYDLAILDPLYVPLDIALLVCIEPDAFGDQVELALREEFGTGTLADGRLAFFHPDRFSFGESVWLSQIVARCMGVPGVHYVDVRSSTHPSRFRRRGRVQGSEIDDGLIRIAETEIARCDSDPNAPEMGTIDFYVEGGA